MISSDKSFVWWQRVTGIVFALLFGIMFVLHCFALHQLYKLQQHKTSCSEMHKAYVDMDNACNTLRHQCTIYTEQRTFFDKIIYGPQPWRDAVIRIAHVLGVHSYITVFSYNRSQSNLSIHGVAFDQHELMNFLQALRENGLQSSITNLEQKKTDQHIEFSLQSIIQK